MRRRDVIFTGLAGAALAACASPSPPEPLAQLPDGRLLVVAPAADFDPARPPPGWSRHGDRAARMRVSPHKLDSYLDCANYIAFAAALRPDLLAEIERR